MANELLSPIIEVAVAIVSRADDEELRDAAQWLDGMTTTNCWSVEYWMRASLLQLVRNEQSARKSVPITASHEG